VNNVRYHDWNVKCLGSCFDVRGWSNSALEGITRRRTTASSTASS